VIAARRGRNVFANATLRVPLTLRGQELMHRRAVRATIQLRRRSEFCGENACSIDRFASAQIPVTLHGGSP
jgi:hypothetical protein